MTTWSKSKSSNRWYHSRKYINKKKLHIFGIITIRLLGLHKDFVMFGAKSQDWLQVTLTACLFKYKLTKKIHLHKKSMTFYTFYTLHNFITQCLKNMLLYSIETVLLFVAFLQCYFNGHASGTPGGGRCFPNNRFWLAVTSWGLCLLTM